MAPADHDRDQFVVLRGTHRRDSSVSDSGVRRFLDARALRMSATAAAILLPVAAACAQSVAGWGSTGFSNIDTASGSCVQVAAGSAHTIAIRTDGTVACWGANSSGQCNAPESLAGVVQIAAGSAHNAALLNDGSVRCWGANSYGQSIVPAGLGPVAAVAAGDFHTVALKAT
ncbi:MAG: RCC1 domain-containing protein, partial [Phycisphaerales bacterium]